MATVITNLLSAIPIFGQDLVESNYDIKIFTYLGTEILNLITLPVLPTVGTISIHALKKGKQIQIRLDKKDYLSIPDKFISFLVGLIDGNGQIKISRTTKGFIAIKLVITLSLEDLCILEYLQSVLKLGSIEIKRDIRSPNCKLIINKTDLQEIIFPLIIHHKIFFLTRFRKFQFDLAMYIFINNIKLYEQISDKKEKEKEIPTIFELPSVALDYYKLAYFKHWLIGFTNVKGSFKININNKEGYFQIKGSVSERIPLQLLEAFSIFFNSYQNTNIIEKDSQFTLSSKNDIQKVINYFSFSGSHPLIGLKSIEYFKWLNKLQTIYHYKNIYFPK